MNLKYSEVQCITVVLIEICEIIEICAITINLRTVISMPFVLAQYGYPE